MDKARDVRRGATRLKHSGHKLCVDGGGEDVLSSEKSKKEKLRKLSAVVGRSSSSQEDCEMGIDVSDKEDELRSPSTSNRIKLSEKFSDDCNGVGHASVPRRLRSAIKKRGRDSVSPLSDSKKLNHTISGTHSQKMSAIKKLKSNMKQRASDKCPKRTISGPITKDEEEVAETLYALAGMFINNNSNDKSKQVTESLEPNPSDFPESKSAVEAEENVSSALPLTTDEAIVPSSSADKVNEMVKVDSLNEPSSQANPIILDDYVPRMKLSSVAKSEQQLNVKPSRSSSVKFSIPSEKHLDTGLKQPQQKDALLLEKKKEIGLGKATPIKSQSEPRHAAGESEKAGMTLLPGLPSTVSQGSGVADTSSPLTAAKIPTWLDVPSCSPKTSSVQNNSSRKVSKVTTIKRKLSKRCATHVYISRLIQALKKSECEDMLTLPKNHKRSHEEGLKHGVSVTINNNMYGEKNDLIGLVSADTIANDAVNKNSNGANSGVLQQRVDQDQPLSALPSDQFTMQTQNFDFLSLSAGGSGLAISDVSSRTRNVFEPLSPLQVPYPHSLVENQFRPYYSSPLSSYNSSAYPDHISSAGQVHPYGTLFYDTQASSGSLTKPQQQEQLWSAHYRPDDTPKSTSQIANWQNGATTERHQQQQQPLISMASSPFPPPGKVTKQDHHMPSVYEEHGGGFRTSALPLQLLCHESL
ncbi:uncharacterized protein LOC133804388 isoform X2 [Humulus lupulus]|uniref:uncharacterized protein LOC133804388 isoform X2 n=1 Tax=Humulus lupulus TaxID=3486 RepID=UPI002B409583|nr:uncharacterized protein LOC133804388 isoform X2 [Humulus lupulus]